MDPDFKSSPQQPNMQGVYGPTLQNSDGVQPSFQPPKPLKSSKRKFVIVGVVVVGLVILIAVLFNLPQTPKKQTPQSQDTSETHTETDGPQPATAVSTEQDNNAVSQEIGNLNDDHDFPADQLSDDNLEL